MVETKKKPHIVCIPCPGQGHINSMMQLAKLLNSRGFFITFVNTDFTHRRMLRSNKKESLESVDGFRFETISDGLPATMEIMEDLESFLKTVQEECPASFRELLRKLHRPSDGFDGVNYIISDLFMTFTLKVAEEVGIPEVLFCPMAACSFMAFTHYHELAKMGFAQLRDESSYIGNECLDTVIDWIPGMKGMRLRDLGDFNLITPSNDFLTKFAFDEAQNSLKAPMILFNTFEDLEHEVVDALQSMFPPRINSIGPLWMRSHSLPNDNSIKSSMWKEETECLEWLNSREASSVIYVNFGSSTVTTPQQIIELAWAFANSKHPLLWIIRPDLVMGGHSILPQEFMDEIEGRGMLLSWCPQAEVLTHPSIGLFFTHCGWNSTLESISSGVPMLCWPYLGDQYINCSRACKEWGVGMEVGRSAKREEVADLIQEAMQGEKGKEMRKKALKWKESAKIAVKEGGSSHTGLEFLIQEILQQKDEKDLKLTCGRPYL